MNQFVLLLIRFENDFFQFSMEFIQILWFEQILVRTKG